jgi:hypothetical protein
MTGPPTDALAAFARAVDQLLGRRYPGTVWHGRWERDRVKAGGTTSTREVGRPGAAPEDPGPVADG